MNGESFDQLLEILKFLGLLITAATGLLGLFTTKNWEEYEVKPVILALGHAPEKKRRLTPWGKWSIFFMIFGAVVGLAAQGVETLRTKRKEAREANEKKEERASFAREKQHERDQFAREKKQDREEFDRKFRESSQRTEAALAELIFQKNDVERTRIQLLEAARNAHIEIALPKIEPISSTNIEQAIETAMKAIPIELKAAAAQRSQAEAERIAAQARARELDKLIRQRVIYAFDLIRTVVAHAQQKGLVTVTNLGPAPVLPERIVYSQQETNIPMSSIRGAERLLGTNIQQRIDFAHGDVWVVYLVAGVVQSTITTNEHLYPKLRIKDNAGLRATIWFDPVSAELQMSPGPLFGLSDNTALKSERGVSTNLVEFLKQSRLRYSP